MIRTQSVRHGRYLGFLSILLLTAGLLALWAPFDVAFTTAFDLAALLFLLSSARHWFEGAPQTIREQAARDDGGRIALLTVTAVVVAAVMAAVGSLIRRRGQLGPELLILTVGTLVLAWAFANIVMAYHYAHRFYDRDVAGGDHGGLEFPGQSQPCFADFVNFAFVLGMTCQTADVAITNSTLRRVATVHGVLAFFFNLGILALVVNTVASSL